MRDVKAAASSTWAPSTDSGLPNLVAYAAAKGGLLSMTRTLAGALASIVFASTTFIPGWIATEGELKIQKGEGRDIEDLERAGTALPSQIANRRRRRLRCNLFAQRRIRTSHRRRPHVDAGGSMLPIQTIWYPG